MSNSATGTWTFEEELVKRVGRKPSQQVANGIQSLCNKVGMFEVAASQVKDGIKAENDPLTEEILYKILTEVGGLTPEEARKRTYAVFGK